MNISASEARKQLSELISLVQYKGERIIIERHGKPIAVLVPYEDFQRLESHDAEQQKQ